jgi:ABC-type multidrug transport system fused ATPase/permease subunit
LGLPNYDKLPEAELDRLIKDACQKANCWDFIQNLPQKIDTNVGEGSILLSGGQKQRIAIARAIIKNPRILLLDEATSALDTQSERIVQEALENASKDRTTIVIAHRLSTVKNADLIVVMASGDVVEQGQHDQLIVNDGVYANLVKTQSLKTRVETDVTSKIDTVELKRSTDVPAQQSGVQVLKLNDDSAQDKASDVIADFKIDYSRLFSWNRSEYHWWVVGGFGAAINGASQPLFALLFAEVLTALGTPRAYTYAYVFIGLAIVAFLSNFMQVGLFDYAGEKMTRRVREACFRSLLKQEIGFFDQEENSTGALTAKLAEDASLIQGLTGKTFAAVIQGISGVVAGMIIAFSASWQLSLVIFGLVPVIGIAGFLQMQALVGYGDKTRVAFEDSSRKASEAILNIRTIITITQESTFYRNYADSIFIPHSMTVQSAFVSSAGFAFSQSVLHFAWATALYYGAQLMKWGLYNGGQIMQAMFAIIFTAMAAGQVSNFTPDAAKAKLAAVSVFRILDRESQIDVSKSVGEQRTAAQGNALLEEIEFSYPARPDTKILKGLNLKADTGMTVALVGKSGCGKSTVMGMLLRWYDPSSGKVVFDGLNEKDWDLKTLRSFMAIVGQEPVLFNISIRDNIAYGGAATSTCDDLAIIDAAKLANIHDFISSLPKGYDTLVGEKGGQISGGQKQRIAIARALIRNPRLLLLDEATSALDSESEHVVQEALDAAAKGRTTIVIAHRLSTIQNADLILVVDNGEIIESGSHFDLIDKNGIYSELVNQQKLK